MVFREIRLRKEKKAPEQPVTAQTDVSQNQPKSSEPQKKYGKIVQFYHDKYKILMIIPLLLLILAIVQLGWQYQTTGAFINKGIALKGGVTVTVTGDQAVDALSFQNKLKEIYPQTDISVKTLSSAGTPIGTIVEADITEKEAIDDFKTTLKEELKASDEDLSVEVVGSSLGDSFFNQMMKALLIAFIFMAIVVFLYFRTLVPSAAVVLAAFTDIAATLAVVNIMEIKLGPAGLAAILMLIGYSVDTDMLLTIRVLKRKEGHYFDRILSSIKTGTTMTFASMAAVTACLLISKSEVLTQIMTVLLIGLVIDLIATWIQNVGILRLYLEKKGMT